jgi:5-methylcytosine-specific restriction endonuclease McrA
MAAKTYSTGRPCPRGHTLRYASDNGCVECKLAQKAARRRAKPEEARAAAAAYRLRRRDDPEANARDKAYRLANRDKLRARSRAWRKDNPERANVNDEAWRRANPGRHQELIAEWAKANPEKMRGYTKAWREKNPDKARRGVAAWVKANPAFANAKAARRRARKLAAPGGDVSTAEWNAVIQDSFGICSYCGDRKPLAVDHIQALNRGGAHDLENLTAACVECNSSKSDRPLLVWLIQRSAR